MGVKISELNEATTMTNNDFLEAEVSAQSKKVKPSTIVKASNYFDTTTGHDHDGINSKKVDKENIVGLKVTDIPRFKDVVIDNISIGKIPLRTSAGFSNSNLTNDAQLKRSEQDFTTFTSKTSPSSNDVILIEDSDDGYKKKKVTYSSFGGHPRQHAITSTLDHTSSATEGKLLKADANGLPVSSIYSESDIGVPLAGKRQVIVAGKQQWGFADFMYSGQYDIGIIVPSQNIISGGDYSSTYSKEKAFDGDDATYWYSAQPGSAISGVAYIGVTGLMRKIKALKILGYTDAANNIPSVKLQYSDNNGATWTDIQTSVLVTTASAWNEIHVADFNPSSYPYWFRILANSNITGNYWIVATIQLFYNDNLDVCTTGNAYCYDYDSDHPASYAFNNINTDYYVSSAFLSTGNLYLGQSGLTSAVKAVRLLTYSSAVSNAREVRLSWKQNAGDNWIDLATYNIPTDGSQWITIPVPPYSPSGSHYFALRPTTNCSSIGTWAVYEMEFYTGIDNYVNLEASTSFPFITNKAYGEKDKIDVVTSDVNNVVSSLVAGRQYFIYQDRYITTGAITYGKTPIAPQYGKIFDFGSHNLLHFDGSLKDEYGTNWHFAGDGTINSTQKKFGSSSIYGTTGMAISPNAARWGAPFTIEMWVRFNSVSSLQYFFNTAATHTSVVLGINASGKLITYMESAQSGWDIANGLTGVTTLSANTWYKIILEWDGQYYRLWCGTNTANMKLELSIKNSNSPYAGYTTIELGGRAGADPMAGYMDAYRATWGSCRYGWSPVAEVDPFVSFDSDIHFFDLSKMKMYVGNNNGGLTEKQRIFLGECYMDAQGVTSLANYALNGHYESDWFPVINNTVYTKYDNVGVRDKQISLLGRQNAGYPPTLINQVFCTNDYGASWGTAKGADRMATKIKTAGNYVSPYNAIDGFASNEQATGEYKVIVTRPW